MSEPIIGAQGVKSYPNDFTVPLGSLEVGDDIECNRPGVFEPRRGFPKWGNTFPLVGPMRQQYWWNGYPVGYLESAKEFAYFDGVDWHGLGGSYDKPATNIQPPGVVANQSLFVSTASGVHVLDSLANGFRPAGVPRALDITLASAGAGTAVNAGSQAAYRYLWGTRDANGYLKLGAPSQRQVITNSGGGAINVTVTVRLQAGVTTSHFLQVYRTASSPDANTDPGDTMQLVYEYALNNVDVSNGTVTFTDVAPDSLRGAALYTNSDLPNGGFAAARLPPPVARCMAAFKGSVFYGYCRQRLRVTLNLLSNDFKVGESLKITSIDASGTTQYQSLSLQETANFAVSTGGTAAQNIDGTARAIVKAANILYGSATANRFVASYLSGPEDPPGKMLFESVDFPLAAYVYASNAKVDKYSPSLPSTYPTSLSRSANVVTVTSSSAMASPPVVGQLIYLNVYVANPNFSSGFKTVATVISNTQFTFNESGSNASIGFTSEIFLPGGAKSGVAPVFGSVSYPSLCEVLAEDAKNAVYWSEPGMPDSVPLRNGFRVGADDKAVLAMVPLRDSLMVFKEDGLFKITGSGGVFSWEAIDSTLHLLAPLSAKPLQNEVYAFTDQGVVAVPEQGSARVVGFDIQDKLPLSLANNNNAFTQCWAVAQESRREYRLAMPSQNFDFSQEQWIYNTFTDTWLRHRVARYSGLVSPAEDPTSPDYLWMATATYMTRDSKSTLPGARQYDYIAVANIINVSGTRLTLDVLPTDFTLSVGDTILTGQGQSVIVGVDLGNKIITVNDDLAYTNGACGLYGGFECVMTWKPFAQPSPTEIKQLAEVAMHFRSSTFSTATLSFSTDMNDTPQVVDMVGPTRPAQTPLPWVMRTFVPESMRWGTRFNVSLKIRNARAVWQFQGLELTMADDTQEIRQ